MFENKVICQSLGFIHWLLCLLIGNPLMIGLMHFEKYGGDPSKRNLIDMVSDSV